MALFIFLLFNFLLVLKWFFLFSIRFFYTKNQPAPFLIELSEYIKENSDFMNVILGPTSAHLGVIQQWLDSDMKQTPYEISLILFNLTVQGPRSSIGL